MTAPTDESLMNEALARYLNDGDFGRVYSLFPEQPYPSVRRKVYLYRDKLARASDGNYRPPAPTVTIESGLADWDDIDEDTVWQRAVDENRKAKELLRRQRSGRLTFDYGAVCLVFMADMHLGGTFRLPLPLGKEL